MLNILFGMWLNEAIVDAANDKHESTSGEDKNSYGAGYDTGFLDALYIVETKIRDLSAQRKPT